MNNKDYPSSKTELAKKMGIEIPKDGYWGNISSKTCGLVGGAIGGNMVKKMVEEYEKNLDGKKDM